MVKKCTGMGIIDKQCPHDAEWRNENGVTVCEYHKLLLDVFNWETRGERKWTKLEESVK